MMSGRGCVPGVVVGCLIFGVWITGAGQGAGPDAWRPAAGTRRGVGPDGTIRVRDGAGQGNVIQLEYAIPKPTMAKAGAADGGRAVVEFPGAPLTGAPGKPILPVVPCRVVLPPQHGLDKIEVVVGDAKTLPGTHKLDFGKQPVPISAGGAVQPARPDPEVYGADDPWPRERYTSIGVQHKRGVGMLIVNLHPIVYRPKSGVVSYYPTMRLKVTTKPAEQGGRLRYRPGRVGDMVREVDNPAMMARYKAR